MPAGALDELSRSRQKPIHDESITAKYALWWGDEIMTSPPHGTWGERHGWILCRCTPAVFIDAIHVKISLLDSATIYR